MCHNNIYSIRVIQSRNSESDQSVYLGTWNRKLRYSIISAFVYSVLHTIIYAHDYNIEILLCWYNRDREYYKCQKNSVQYYSVIKYINKIKRNYKSLRINILQSV